MQRDDKNLNGVMVILWRLNYVATLRSESAFTHGKPQVRGCRGSFGAPHPHRLPGVSEP